MANKRSRNNEPVRGKHAAPPASAPTPTPRRAEAPLSAAAADPHRTQSGQSAQKPASQAKVKKAKKKRRMPLAAKIVISLVLVVVLAGGGFLVWDYLFRYDDAKDIQGQWKIEGSTSSIVITDSEIRLTDSVNFTYELNTFEKTITYGYANFSGKGSYVFSPERDVLTLTDISEEPNEGDANSSMHLLKVSDRAVGEPETANNNDTADANSYGGEVVDGSLSGAQAERDTGTGTASKTSSEQ